MKMIEKLNKLTKVLKSLTKEETDNIELILEGKYVDGKYFVRINEFVLSRELFKKIEKLLG